MSVFDDVFGGRDVAARESIKELSFGCGVLAHLLAEKGILAPGELEEAMKRLTPVFDQECARMRDEARKEVEENGTPGEKFMMQIPGGKA